MRPEPPDDVHAIPGSPMSHRAPNSRDRGQRSDRRRGDGPPDPYRTFSEQAVRQWEFEERRSGRLERRRTLLLLGALAVVALGTLEILGSPVPRASLSRTALGSVVLGLTSFGAAVLALLGAAPPAPSLSRGPIAGPLVRAFFPEPRGSGRPAPRENGEAEDPRWAFLAEAEDLPAPTPGSAPRVHRSSLRSSAEAALEVREGNRRKRRCLGWAGVGIALGVVLLLTGAVLSLSAYSVAVLMVLAGLAGILTYPGLPGPRSAGED